MEGVKGVTAITAIDKRVKGFTKGGEKAVVERVVRECIRGLDHVVHSDENIRKKYQSGQGRRESMVLGLKPVIETKSMKRSGIAHQVPTPVSDQRGLYRAWTWIREATLKRSKKMGISFGDARRLEFMAIYDDFVAIESGVENKPMTTMPIQIRDRTHRAAKANRVFASGR